MRSLRSAIITSGVSWPPRGTFGLRGGGLLTTVNEDMRTSFERCRQVNSIWLGQVPNRPDKYGARSRLLFQRGPEALNFLLRLRPAESDEKLAPGDRAAERRRYPERQAGVDRTFGVVHEALAGLLVAFEMGKSDARLAEDRTVTLHHQHDRQPRTSGAERLVAHASAELALKLHERIGRRGILSERERGAASERRDQSDHRPGERHRASHWRRASAGLRPHSATNVITLVQECAS